jgi:acyl-CoA-binding protein
VCPHSCRFGAQVACGQLYALYKIATVGLSPSTSRPGVFDFTGRAKWDSWKRKGESVEDSSEARRAYVELVKRLGWSSGQDDDPESSTASSSGPRQTSSKGMVSVSTFTTSQADAE